MANFCVGRSIFDRHIAIEKVKSINGSIKLMSIRKWNYEKQSHLLINGASGTGKTYLMFGLMLALLKGECEKEDLFMTGTRDYELTDFAFILPNVCFNSEMKQTIHLFYQAMFDRLEEINGRNELKFGKTYRDFGFRPQFLFIDELGGFLYLLKERERKEVLFWLKEILLYGKKLGYFLVVSSRLIDSNILEEEIRKLFQFKIGLKMRSYIDEILLFGKQIPLMRISSPFGVGYAECGDDLFVFFSPFISKNTDLLGLFREAVL